MRRMDYVHINGEGELVERPTGSLVDYSNYAKLETELSEERAHSEDLRSRWKDLLAHAEALEAQAVAGWDAFYKLRKAVGEDRYPGMTGEVTPASGGTVE